MHKKHGKKPLVSVVMPVYNTKEEYLRAAIESILNQTFRKFELIVVDDCSTKEGIKDIVMSYKDPRIRFVKQDKNQGDAVARNRAIEMARGEFIAMQDSDDISRPERLAIQLEYMKKYPEVGVLGTAYNVFPSPQEKVMSKFGSPEYLNSYTLFHNSPFGHSSVMMRASVLKELGVKYDKNYICNDFKLWTDMLGKTKFMNVPKVLIDYRWHGDNISVKKADVMNEQVAQIRTQAWVDELNLHPKNKELLIRFLKGEQVSLPEQRKAMNIIKSVFKTYEKKEHNPRAFQMFTFLIEGIKERALANGQTLDEKILDWRNPFQDCSKVKNSTKTVLNRQKRMRNEYTRNM